MKNRPSLHKGRDLRSGQTLIIAVIILGILITLGFAFSSIISRNIKESDRSRLRNVATDLARAGAEYAHHQLRYSLLGADWRPSPTPPDTEPTGYSRDPDALYLRPADPTLPFSDNPALTGIPDLGGPDGYGAYSRVLTDRGRELIRVRFAPFMYDAFANPNGQIREPGKVRDYITIETVGRPGSLRTGARIDPTFLLPERVKVTNYANITEKTSEIGRLKAVDNTLVNTRKLLAYSSIGIIESLRFITDKNNLTRVAELGFPNEGNTNGFTPTPFDQSGLGVRYGDGFAPFSNNPDDVQPVRGQMVWGEKFLEPNLGKGNNWTTITGLGSLVCNSALKLYGTHQVNLNTSFGEGWNVAGPVSAANGESFVNMTRTYYDRATDQWKSDVTVSGTVFPSTVNNPVTLTGLALDSGQSAFTTVGGIFRDGSGLADDDGYVRGMSRKEPPSIMTLDPQNGSNRFLSLTRDSGMIVNNRNIGRYGFGRGVYVDSTERGNTNSEDERAIAGAVKALQNDWLNPNNATSQGWKGPYYIPIAAYLKLLPDGFEIVRDSRSRNLHWRNQNGGTTGSALARFRIRTVEYPLGSGKFQPMILNSVMNPALVGLPGGSLQDDDFRTFGQLFNGVIYFEGDVRVRGVIPTDQQLTVVSMGSIYVEGSVIKGVVDEFGTTLTRPSRSAIMLSCRDYIVVNTTMFFGPSAGESVDEKNENAVPDTPNPFELKLENPEIILEAQFLLDPETPPVLGGNPVNPSTWQPFANHYITAGGNTPISANLLVSSSADDNGPAFVSLDIAPGSYSLVGSWNSYLFPRDVVFGAQTHQFNAAAGYFTGLGNVPVYGLGDPTLNAYPKFETVEFPVVNSNFNYVGRKLIPNSGILGTYETAVQDPTRFRVRMNGIGNVPMKNFLASHTAIAPHDVRIEAAMFAEEGSFFVIPGNWFNTTTQDTRRNWLDRSANSIYSGMTDDQANERRFELFGHTPSVPFYSEPLDVKISIIGSVSENMPAPIGAQAEWLKKWGWIPRMIGSTGLRIPMSHTSGFDPNVFPMLPNLTMTYDPVFASSSVWDPVGNAAVPVRTDENGWVLPPMPRLPVSPTLAYFGEVNP